MPRMWIAGIRDPANLKLVSMLCFASQARTECQILNFYRVYHSSWLILSCMVHLISDVSGKGAVSFVYSTREHKLSKMTPTRFSNKKDGRRYFRASCDLTGTASVRHPASHLRHGSMMIRPAGVLLLAAVTPILV
jgi:hypothetical protein